MLTLTICSWLLVALGTCVSLWLCPHPLVFLPYIFLALAIRVARRLAVRSVLLALTLACFCFTFWYCWDAAFVRVSTMNMMPIVVGLAESLVATVTWRTVRHIETVRHEKAT